MFYVTIDKHGLCEHYITKNWKDVEKIVELLIRPKESYQETVNLDKSCKGVIRYGHFSNNEISIRVHWYEKLSKLIKDIEGSNEMQHLW